MVYVNLKHQHLYISNFTHKSFRINQRHARNKSLVLCRSCSLHTYHTITNFDNPKEEEKMRKRKCL